MSISARGTLPPRPSHCSSIWTKALPQFRLDLFHHPLRIIEIGVHVLHCRNGNRTDRHAQLPEPAESVDDLLGAHARPRFRIVDDFMALADSRSRQTIHDLEGTAPVRRL